MKGLRGRGMNKAVMISIKPKWCELIAKGKKTLEVRKTRPKIKTPFKCYIYMTKSNLTGDRKAYKDRMAGKVIGEFVCDFIYENISYDSEDTCVSASDLKRYANGKSLFGWHISDFVIYNPPKEIGEFRKAGALSYDDWLYGIYNGEFSYEKYLLPFKMTRPPQSWCYVEEK